MGRAVFIVGLMSLCLTPFACALQPVLDATNAGHLVNLVTETRRQFQELKGITTMMENMNGRLGGVLPSTDAQHLANINQGARQWGQYIDSLSSPASSLSLLNTVGFQQFGLGNGERLTAMTAFLADKLYPSTQQPLSYPQMEVIKQTRLTALKNASIQGAALSGDKKHSLPPAQRKIVELGMQGLRAPTLHDDLLVTNQLLTVIAHELTQQREILSHQLELLSAVVAQGYPLAVKNNAAGTR